MAEAPSPSGLPSSYLNEYSGGQLIATGVAFMILSCTIVALRFYTRIATSGVRLGLDDYMAGPALCSNIILEISCLGKSPSSDLEFQSDLAISLCSERRRRLSRRILADSRPRHDRELG